MSSPRQSIFWMLFYLAVVAGVCYLLYPSMETAFLANWGFNSLIVGVLFIGIVINFRQVLVLQPENNWVKLFRTGEAGISVAEEPRLLKPLARHLQGKRKDRFRLTALSLRTVLDGIRSRLDESREISRYMIGLLVFLGLLGTFWGLLGTISTVSQVVGGLDVDNRDFTQVFHQLKMGLQTPLEGMGTAFSSSLFGLGGSLILGFIDILAGHAQNRFFNGLEEWLSGVTQLVDEAGHEDESHGTDLSPMEQRLSLLIEELSHERRLLNELIDTAKQQNIARPPESKRDLDLGE